MWQSYYPLIIYQQDAILNQLFVEQHAVVTCRVCLAALSTLREVEQMVWRKALHTYQSTKLYGQCVIYD